MSSIINKRNAVGHTPLTVAVEFSNNKPDVVKILIDNGAYLFGTNKKGQTPFDIAFKLNYKAIYDVLICKAIELRFKYIMNSPDKYVPINKLKYVLDYAEKLGW